MDGYRIERCHEGLWIKKQEHHSRDAAIKIAAECGHHGEPHRVIKPETGATVFDSLKDEYRPEENA